MLSEGLGVQFSAPNIYSLLYFSSKIAKILILLNMAQALGN